MTRPTSVNPTEPALWAGSDEQRLEHHVRERLLHHASEFDGLVCFVHRAESVRKFLGVFVTRGDPRPFFDPDALGNAITVLGYDALDRHVPDQRIRAALVTTWARDEDVFTHHYVTGDEAEKFQVTPASLHAVTEEVRPV